MDTLNNGQVNSGTREDGLTEQNNTGSNLCKPSSEGSEGGLLSVQGRAESPKASLLPVEQLRHGARELGVELTDAQVRQLDQFAELLVEANKTLNLTRITDPTEIVINHYLDSLTCLAAVEIEQNARVIDIGTGAGFPGVPVKIARPDLDMTLMDASRKKLAFIERALTEIGERIPEGPCCKLVHARAEEAGRDTEHREAYDVAFARAVAEMKVLTELALPLVKVGGVLIAQKSEGSDTEIEAAKPLVGRLGGKIEKIARMKIPGTDITRLLVVVAKKKSTPPEFPRPYSRISKLKGQKPGRL